MCEWPKLRGEVLILAANETTVAGVWMWCTPWLRGRGGESTSPRISIPSATIFLHDTLFSIS